MTKRTDRCHSYSSVHQHAQRLWGNARNHPCIRCSQRARHWAYDGTDPTELMTRSGLRYSIWPEFYMPMCPSCHSSLDRNWQPITVAEWERWELQRARRAKLIRPGFRG